MYKTLLVFKSQELLTEIQKLRIWGEPSEFEITAVMHDGLSAYNAMKQNKYDLVISEIELNEINGLQLLRQTKQEGLCSHFVICSEFVDINYARQGIILGAFDYFIKPFDESLFFSMFNRIKNETYENEAIEVYHSDEIINFFENRDNGIYEYIKDMLDKIYDESNDILAADKKAKQIYNSVIDKVFDSNEWLDLYLEQEGFYADDSIHEGNYLSYKKYYTDMLSTLFKEYCELSPNANNEKIQEVILYILNNPESDLKQKTIASKLYINSSYLSTVFTAHTELRFVDYLTSVKLKRAAWLLKNTSMKIIDVATRLDYKDIGYFSRLFKKQYGITPSVYRIPDNYNYQI